MQRPKSLSLAPLKRQWPKVIQPLTSYKRQDNGLDYCLDFFHQIQKMIQLNYKICVNIPLTLTGAHDNFLYTKFENENAEVGEIRLVPSFSKMKFQLQVQKSIKQSLQKIKKKSLTTPFTGQSEQTLNNKSLLLPFIALKQKTYPQAHPPTTSTLIMNSYEYKRLSTIESSQVVQAYLFTSNMRASFTRFFYGRGRGKGVAYRVENLDGFGSGARIKKLWKVEEGKENSCHFIKIMYENKSFYEQTLNLIACIEKFMQKEVEEIVTDWIIDPTGRYYLIDVKSTTLTPPNPKPRLQKSLSELLSTVTCSMCLQTCPKSQIQKILTSKLILNFHNHLKSRGAHLSFRINFKKISNLSRVCDLCYSLVVAQSRLIQVERVMGRVCNFGGSGDGERGEGDRGEGEGDGEREDQLGVQMYQWRLFFYLEDIRNFSTVINSYENELNSDTKLYLNLQINNSSTQFQLHPPYPETLSTKILKISHIFSQTAHIKPFLNSAEVRIQLVLKPKSRPPKPIAQGCLHGVYDQAEQNYGQTFLQRKYKQVLLFMGDARYCTLGMYVGFCCDGRKCVSGRVRDGLGVWRGEGGVGGCLSLPAQWMEIVYQRYGETAEVDALAGLQNRDILKPQQQNRSQRSVNKPRKYLPALSPHKGQRKRLVL